MAQLDLSEYRRLLFDGRSLLAASDAPRVRFAYRGHRLAPVSGLSRTWLLAALGGPPAMAEVPRDELAVEEAAIGAEGLVDQDAPTDVLALDTTDETQASTEPEPCEPAAEQPELVEPELEPIAATFVDAITLQMWLVDALRAQGFRLERFTTSERDALEVASAELVELEARLAEIGASGEPPREVQGALRKLGRELSSLATFAEVTLANVALALDADAASAARREARAPLDLGEPSRAEKAREPERGRDARGAPTAASRAADVVRVGRVKVRFSPKEVRVLKVVAFAVMPLVVAAAIALQYWRATAVAPASGGAESALSNVAGHAVGDLYVIELPRWSDFDGDRVWLLDLTKAVSAAGYRGARFEYAGKVVAVWEQGKLTPAP